MTTTEAKQALWQYSETLADATDRHMNAYTIWPEGGDICGRVYLQIDHRGLRLTAAIHTKQDAYGFAGTVLLYPRKYSPVEHTFFDGFDLSGLDAARFARALQEAESWTREQIARVSAGKLVVA